VLTRNLNQPSITLEYRYHGVILPVQHRVTLDHSPPSFLIIPHNTKPTDAPAISLATPRRTRIAIVEAATDPPSPSPACGEQSAHLDDDLR